MDAVHPPAGHERFDNIDALRALAVIWVMLFHYTARFPADYLGYRSGTWSSFPDGGQSGVLLFFIVSGYCIAMTAARCRSLALFWARRFSRLQPAYVAAIAITFTVVTLFGLPRLQISGLDALGNIIWLNGMNKVPAVDGVYWTLVWEARLYILFGVLFYALRERADPVLWWTAGCLAGWAVWAIDRAALGGAVDFHSFSLATFAFPYSGFFLAGIVIYRWDQTRPWVRALACATYLAASCFIARNSTMLAILVGMLPFAYLVLRLRTFSVPSPIVFIGFVSYPLYLVHQNVGIVVIRQLAPLVPSAPVRVLIAAVVTLAIAALLSLTVEHRFRKPIEQLAEKVLATILNLPSRLRVALVEPGPATKQVIAPEP